MIKGSGEYVGVGGEIVFLYSVYQQQQNIHKHSGAIYVKPTHDTIPVTMYHTAENCYFQSMVHVPPVGCEPPLLEEIFFGKWRKLIEKHITLSKYIVIFMHVTSTYSIHNQL